MKEYKYELYENTIFSSQNENFKMLYDFEYYVKTLVIYFIEGCLYFAIQLATNTLKYQL